MLYSYNMINLDCIKDRFVEKYNLDEYQYMITIEALKDYFFANKYIKDNNLNDSISMTNSLADEVWHLFIIYTKEYFEFSNNLFNQYFHHIPFESKLELNEINKNELINIIKYLDIVRLNREYENKELQSWCNKGFIPLLCHEMIVNDLSYEDSLNLLFKFLNKYNIFYNEKENKYEF